MANDDESPPSGSDPKPPASNNGSPAASSSGDTNPPVPPVVATHAPGERSDGEVDGARTHESFHLNGVRWETPQPLQAADFIKLAQDSEQITAADAQTQFFQIGRRRRFIGYLAMLVGFAGILSIGFGAMEEMRTLWVSGEPFGVTCLKFGGHAVVAIFTIYALYQLIKAGERLALPPFYTNGDVRVARVLLGIVEPSKEAAGHFKKALELLKAFHEATPKK